MTKQATSDQRRNDLAVKVMTDLAVRRRELPVTTADGERPIVVALDGDLLSDVFARVRVCGGQANLFVELDAQEGSRPEDEIVLLRAAVNVPPMPKAEVFSDEPMPKGTTIGMMAEYVLKAPDGVRVHIQLPELGSVENVNRSDLVDA